MHFVRRLCTHVNPSKYVEKVRLLEYWRVQDDVLRKEFFRAKMLLILDKSPLLVKGTNGFQLSRHTLPELEKSLGDYGVFFDIHNSCLLDAEVENNFWVPLFGISVKTETPPEGSPVDKKQVIRGLGDSLGGRFMDIRSAMFMVSSEEDRLLLARFYSLSKWAHVFCRCPRCAAALVTKISKASARCRSCNIAFYPNISPAIISLIKNHENSHLLLVRQRNYTPGMYTCVAGFANVGEHLHETVKREVAEEVGIEIEHVVTENYTQPWPLPDGSLMIPNVSVADMNQPIDKCPAELENARWFSREEVQAAFDRTLADPLYKERDRHEMSSPSDESLLNHTPFYIQKKESTKIDRFYRDQPTAESSPQYVPLDKPNYCIQPGQSVRIDQSFPSAHFGYGPGRMKIVAILEDPASQLGKSGSDSTFPTSRDSTDHDCLGKHH